MNDRRTIDCPVCETTVLFNRKNLPKFYICPDCGEVAYASKYSAHETAEIFRKANHGPGLLRRTLTRLKDRLKER